MRRFILSLAFSLTWIGQTCLADLVQFEIQGTLSAISGLSPSPANAPAIGSPFVGTYLFDTSAMDTSDPPSFGTYHTPVPPSFVSLKVGDWEWQQTGESPTTIVVGNDLAAGGGGTEDAYSAGNSRIRLFTPDDPNAGMAEYWLFQWDLHGGASIFSNTALPPQAFSLAPWTTNRWSISQWGTPPAPLLEFSGSVTSFTSTVVPEPSTLALLIAVLAGIAITATSSRKDAKLRSRLGAIVRAWKPACGSRLPLR
jgi:hypothetical protein